MELDNKKLFFRARDEKETIILGEAIGKILKPGSKVGLIGPMASGKTLLSRAIFRSHGFDRGVCSPTFAIVNKYLAGGKIAYHIDASRLDSEWELYFQGFSDFEEEADLIIVEWADIVMGAFSESDVIITLKILSVDCRDIIVESLDASFIMGLERTIKDNSCEA